MISNRIKEIVEKRKNTLHIDKAYKDNLGSKKYKDNRRPLSEAIRSSSGISIISEIKPASPTLGEIKKDIDIESITLEMESAGVIGLSILTEPNYFRGSYENLLTAVKYTKLPCLMKDFIIDSLQLKIASLIGATNVLIINSICDLEKMYKEALVHGLEPLIEIHDRQEIEDLKHLYEIGENPRLIGVNNRNLKSLEINLQTSLDIIPEVKEVLGKGILVVSESGINTYQDIEILRSSKADAYLIGSSIMKSNSVKNKILSLRGVK